MQAEHNMGLLFSGFGNNKDADQPAHLRSLISATVVCSLKSIISKLAKKWNFNFQLVSVAEQASLSLTWSETMTTGFLM